jgi:alpha-tubulin suppressor-like RCC1 family protein
MLVVVGSLLWPAAAVAAPPTVTTSAASDVGATSATLNGTVNPNGTNVTDCHFNYGTSIGYGANLQCPLSGNGSSAVPAAATLYGLQPQTTYHFRLVAQNGVDTVPGGDQTFTTPAATASTAPAAGTLLAFGLNAYGELGSATNNRTGNPNPLPAPVALAGQNGRISQLAVGGEYSFAATGSGQLYAFGVNNEGQLGSATNSGTQNPNPTPSLVSLPGQDGAVTSVAAGFNHSLVATAGGQLYGFGDNNYGELGNTADATPNPTPALATLPGQVGAVVQVAAGEYHSLALTASGQLYGFGSNQSGELGSTTNNGTLNPNATPTLISLPGQEGPVTQIAAGYEDSVVLTSSGQLYAFGYNSEGQLGTATNSGTSTPNPTPRLVSLPGQNGPVTQIAAGFAHTLAVTSTGQLYAFGANTYGQLGSATNNGASTPNPTPTLVTLPGQDGRVVGIAAGNQASWAVTSSGQLYAFGFNQGGQLGSTVNSGTANPNPTPALVAFPPGTKIDTVGKGLEAFHVLALVSGLAITSTSLASGQVGSAYSATLSATGVAAPLSWSASGLAPGLSIDAASGAISGTPTGDGNFTVTATVTDAYGIQASQALTQAIAAAPVITTLDTTPVLSGAKQSHKLWREGKRLAKITRTRKPPVGTTFSFSLNEAARVSLTFKRRVGGRKVKGHCVAVTKANRHKRACKRTVIAGRLAFNGHAGRNKIAFQGRISKHRKLPTGRYTLRIVATASGKTSLPSTLSFTIAKP